VNVVGSGSYDSAPAMGALNASPETFSKSDLNFDDFCSGENSVLSAHSVSDNSCIILPLSRKNNSDMGVVVTERDIGQSRATKERYLGKC